MVDQKHQKNITINFYPNEEFYDLVEEWKGFCKAKFISIKKRVINIMQKDLKKGNSSKNGDIIKKERKIILNEDKSSEVRGLV